MGKKKKKRKKEESEEESLLTIIEEEEACDHPLQVKVGNHDVVIISWRDFFYEKHGELISKLDTFIALTDTGFDRYQEYQQRFANPLLRKMASKFARTQRTLHNLIVLEITDGFFNKQVYEIARDLLTEGKRIGFGCLAGHGRTGWLLAKLIMHFESKTGDEAVREARNRLCYKCVETQVQVINLGCIEEMGWYTKKLLKQTPAEETLYDKWMKQNPSPPSPLKTIETIREHPMMGEVQEAWRKDCAGEELTEREERLIMEDIARYG